MLLDHEILTSNIRLVPRLPVPRVDLGGTISRNAVSDPLIHQLSILLITLRYVSPARKDDIIRIRRVEVEEIRIGIRGHHFRHKANLRIWLDVFGEICVEDAVYDRPVVDWITGCIFGVGVGAAEFDGWIAWTGCKQIVSPGGRYRQLGLETVYEI